MSSPTEDRLYRAYLKDAVVRGGEVYIKLPRAQGFIATCEEHDTAVIGIEGFVIQDNATIPQQGMVADFSSLEAASWKDFRNRCNKAAREILEQWGSKPELCANFVVMTKDEWNRSRKSRPR